MARNPDGIVIQTRRFILREFQEEDRRDFLACHRDPEFARFHTASELQDGYMDRVFDRFLFWRSESVRTNFQLAVADRLDPLTYLGTAGVRCEGLPPGTGEIGIELVRALWGKHAATEILKTLLLWAHAELDITDFIAETAEGNHRAERLAEAAGFNAVSAEEKRHWRRQPGLH